MKYCPNCGNSYPEAFVFCPADAGALEHSAADEPKRAKPPASHEAQISVRTLMVALAILVMSAILAFAGLFFYQYLKPKYGGLVVKTTPPGATIILDGERRGVSPITLGDLRSGGHQIRAIKEGYKELVQHVEVMPYATENVHWALAPLVENLTNEQLAEVEAWRKKLDNAQRENILLPPPDDYNVLYFANKILTIDPANAQALEAKNKLADGIRRSAESAYNQNDWLEAEKQYKNLAMIFPDEISINERLADIAAKIDESIRDREQQVAEWQAKAELAIKAGVLLPPDRDNALDALRNIQRLEPKNVFARDALTSLKETLQNRGDGKFAAGDLQGARGDFRLILQFFPEDGYSKSRLGSIDVKLAEVAQSEQQQMQKALEEQQLSQKSASLRQSALNAYRSGSYGKAINEWLEYLKYDPNSDEAYYYIGASYVEQKQFDTAILNLEKSLALNPGNAQAHLQLGLLYDSHRNDLKRASEHLKKVKEMGGVDKYSVDRVQTMIQDLQDRTQLAGMQRTPFAAEHKHAFSSCRGSLRITEAGVEYKTTESDHSFYEPYSSLRSLAVDGDDVSMRTRNNKKYNFHLLTRGDGAKVRRLARSGS
jgi:TolA-binding protein